MSLDNHRIRRLIRQQRHALDNRQRQQAAQQARLHVVTWPRFLGIRNLALYLAADGELDPAPLMQEALHRGIRCYLPILRPIGDNALWFAPWKPGEPLQTNIYGICEPVCRPARLIKPWALDMVITPLVAFSPQGTRMGMGGGYYDRSFAWRNRRQHWCGPLLVGYGYEFQCRSELQARPWDIPLNAVVTEQHIYECPMKQPA